MVFVNTDVPLPPSAALATQADDADSGVSSAVDVDLDPGTGTRDASPSTITVMTTAQIDALTPYTYYASAGYCNPSATKTWTCGANCNANPGFEPIASGGDGSSIQFCSSPLSVTLYSTSCLVLH